MPPEEFEQPETVIVAPEPDAPPVIVGVSDLALANGRIGDIFPVPLDRELPEGYELCDGEQRNAAAYPEFTAAMGIRTPTFVVPAQQRVSSYQNFIIKMKS